MARIRIGTGVVAQVRTSLELTFFWANRVRRTTCKNAQKPPRKPSKPPRKPHSQVFGRAEIWLFSSRDGFRHGSRRASYGGGLGQVEGHFEGTFAHLEGVSSGFRGVFGRLLVSQMQVFEHRFRAL